ncbi:MAG: acetate--CoA ligase family protein [Candidatus Limnocylindrales bacterium]
MRRVAVGIGTWQSGLWCVPGSAVRRWKVRLVNLGQIDIILSGAAAEGRGALLEHEVYAVLREAGCHVPRAALVRPGESPEPALRAICGSQVVLKVASPAIAHKTDVGGVVVVDRDPDAVRAAIDRMLAEVPDRHARALAALPVGARGPYDGLGGSGLVRAVKRDIRGVLVVEKVEREDRGPGSEVLFALRQTREFGPVITMGSGGTDTEVFAAACPGGFSVASASAVMLDARGILDAFRRTLAFRRLTGDIRMGGRMVPAAEIRRVVDAFRAIGERFGDGSGSGWTITELEVNPFGVSQGRLVALDGLLSFRRRQATPAPRPLASLGAMLEPSRIAIVGVSATSRNLGRIILDNVRAAGFDPAHIVVVHPGQVEIDGVACVERIADLPGRIDLVIVALAAQQVPAVMDELVASDRAVGVIVIPGGMAEKQGGQAVEAQIEAAVRRGRERGLPLVVNGGNCLGIVSRPGRYDTLFIPRSKLPAPTGAHSGVALVSQSGAFMITRLSRLPWLAPRYAISTGNQVDLTAGDFVRHLAADPEVRTFAVYVEGFKPGDGLAFARTVRELVAEGRDVVFYKAGRTAEGRRATAGHTASIAGDYAVCEQILRQSGALVAATFDEFLGLLSISALAGGQNWRGRRLAALSNAGYEAVGIADNVRGDGWNLEFAALSPATRLAIGEALTRGRAAALVDVRNPLDLTPMADDEAHEEVLRAFLADPSVDLVLCSTVPLTAAMATLPSEVASAGSLPGRLARLLPETDKPIVASVDSGRLYDPLADAIRAAGVPVFRSVDAALRATGRYAEGRLSRQGERRPPRGRRA